MLPSVRKWNGSWFQTISEAQLKERSAAFVFVTCPERCCCDAERKSRAGLWMLTMSVKYLGCFEEITLWVMRATLYWILSLTGSQCSFFRAGCICSRRLTPVTTRASVSWTTCSFFMLLTVQRAKSYSNRCDYRQCYRQWYWRFFHILYSNWTNMT